MLSREGTRAFSIVPGVTTIAMMMHAMFCKVARDFFEKPVNKIWACHAFYMQFQVSDEMVQEYVMELWMLARDCKLGTMEKEIIATQLVVGCFNADAKEQLLQKPQIDLDAFIALIHSVECSESDLSVLQGSVLSQGKTV